MKKIVVSVSGVACDEKAKQLEDGIRKMIQDTRMLNVIVQTEDTKELKIPAFVNQPYYEERRRRLG